MQKRRKPRRTTRTIYALSAAAGVSLLNRHASAIVSIDDFGFINGELGAYSFYNQGVVGFNATVANIEAGLVWNGHETLNNVVVIPNKQLPSNGQVDRHATWVGQAIAGEGNYTYQAGMAPFATLWTGAIATAWGDPGTPSYSTSFNITDASFITPYINAMVKGINGQTTDIVSSSWTTGDFPAGNFSFDIALDALVAQTGKTMVLAAGNSGPASNTVSSPAAGNNMIVVGATTGDQTTPVYSNVADFSSRGPSDYFVPTAPDGSSGTLMTASRATVDILAPGTDLALAYYGGPTGGNSFGGPSDTFTNFYSYPLAGTSFSTPLTSGSAALVVDAGKIFFSSDPHAIDGRIVKAVLMNSASKLAGWDNGQALVNGVITTTQALDYTQGAGQVNLANAWVQYTGGTTDLPTSSGPIQPIGWTYGTITHTDGAEADNDYTISAPLDTNGEFVITLDWFSNENLDEKNIANLNATYGSFDNLDLQVWQTDALGDPLSMVAQSDSPYNSVEHLDFIVPADDMYMIRVLENGYIYNFNEDSGTDYGLAWSVTEVPEPAIGFMVIVTLGGLSARRRKPVR